MSSAGGRAPHLAQCASENRFTGFDDSLLSFTTTLQVNLGLNWAGDSSMSPTHIKQRILLFTWENHCRY